MPRELVRISIVAIFCACVVLGLVACGGGDSKSDEDQISETANKALVEDDPATCESLATQSFIDSFYGGSLEKCKQDAADNSDNPDSIEATDINVDGDSATAKLTLKGGPNDGQALDVAFKNEGGTWKFDNATVSGGSAGAIADVFFNAVRAQSLKQGLSGAVADCVVADLKASVTTADLQALVASGGKPTPALHDKAVNAGRTCAQQAK